MPLQLCCSCPELKSVTPHLFLVGVICRLIGVVIGVFIQGRLALALVLVMVSVLGVLVIESGAGWWVRRVAWWVGSKSVG